MEVSEEALALIVRAKYNNLIKNNSPYYRAVGNRIIEINPDGSPVGILQKALHIGLSEEDMIRLAQYEARRIAEWKASKDADHGKKEDKHESVD